MTHMRELLREPVSTLEESRLNVIKALMARPGTQGDLVRRTGYSPATISSRVSELLADGTITQLGDRKIGRELKLAPLSGVAVGVELGFVNTVVAVRKAHQSLADGRWRRIPIGVSRGPRAWLDSTVRTVHELVRTVGDHEDDIATVGMAVPGMVIPADQSFAPPALPPWRDGEGPASMLSHALREHADKRGADLRPLRVRLDNDAALGAYAESVYQHPQAETLVFVKASTGVGAGVVIGGQLFRGARGGAGEIGHMAIQPDGLFCQCGGRGCLETVVGGEALLRNVRSSIGTIDDDRDMPSTIDDVVKRARNGDLVCQRVIEEAALRLGHAVGILCNVLNPNVVVLGGAMGREGDLVIEPCMAGIRRSAMRATYPDTFSLVATRMDYGSAHGALLIGIDGEGQRRG